MTVYIRNGAACQSIRDTDTVPAGWTVTDATTAQGLNPQLFGTPDPQVVKVTRADTIDHYGNRYVKDGTADTKAPPANFTVG